MVRLKNIVKNKGVISANYDPEGSGLLGTIVMDASSGKVIESILSEYDKDFPWHYSHAVRALKELKDQTAVPEETLIMWY